MTLVATIDAVAQRIEERRLAESPREVHIPDKDEFPARRGGEVLAEAEGQTFVIEYVDDAGDESVRRITVRKIVAGRVGIPCLRAWCHEREAPRDFRINRIRCCIDLDGEVHDDVGVYLLDSFGLDPSVVRSARRFGDLRERFPIDDRIRNDVTLYAAMIDSDGVHRREELAVALVALLRRLEPRHPLQSPDGQVALARYIVSRRPDARAIAQAVEMIGRREPHEIMDFLGTCARVMDADGERHAAEWLLLNEMAVELTGVELPGW